MNLRARGPGMAVVEFCTALIAVLLTIAHHPAAIDTLGVYAVKITWPAGDNDVDLYLRDPQGAICFFAAPQVAQMQLEHDDLGVTGSGYGRLNSERTIVRSATPGEYVANVQLYRRGVPGAAAIPVTVELWRLRGDDTMVAHRVVLLRRDGDERTVFRFRLSQAGDIAGVAELPQVRLTQATTSYSDSTPTVAS